MRKIIHKWFWPWDFDKEEAWLNEMVSKGLCMISYGWCRYEFEKCEPGEYSIRLQMLENSHSHPESEQYLELINPEIVEQSGEQTGLEGCLSVPNKWGIVTRPNVVKVRAQDRFGDWFEAEAEGLMARAFCHEIEHLDGHLYTEHIDHFLTEDELRAYLEAEEAAAEAAMEAYEEEV